MNTSIIRLNIRSELKLQHRVSTLHLTSSLSFLFHFSSGLFPPFSFSAPSFHLLSLITPDLLLLISPSLSPASLFSLSFSEHDFFSLLFRLSVLCFDSLSLPPSLSVSSPLADERAECFLLPPEQMKMKVWSVCWRRYRGNVSPVCSPSTPNEQLLTRKHLFRKKNTTNESTHTHTQRENQGMNTNRATTKKDTLMGIIKRHTHTLSCLCSWQGVGGSLILIMQQVSISEPRCHLLLAGERDAERRAGSYTIKEELLVCGRRSV